MLAEEFERSRKLNGLSLIPHPVFIKWSIHSNNQRKINSVLMLVAWKPVRSLPFQPIRAANLLNSNIQPFLFTSPQPSRFWLPIANGMWPKRFIQINSVAQKWNWEIPPRGENNTEGKIKGQKSNKNSVAEWSPCKARV